MIDRIVLFSIPIQELKEIIGEIVEEKIKEHTSMCTTTSTPHKEFMTSQEVCQMLHIKMVTLWRYSKDGRLKQHRIGRRVFYRFKEVKDALILK